MSKIQLYRGLGHLSWLVILLVLLFSLSGGTRSTPTPLLLLFFPAIAYLLGLFGIHYL